MVAPQPSGVRTVARVSAGWNHQPRPSVLARRPVSPALNRVRRSPWSVGSTASAVSNERVPLWRANHAFQALQIPAASHQVKLVYEDRRFQLGALISGATMLGCVLLWFRKPKS